MTLIKPFRALRPAPELAKQVSCVPYDVVYETEVRAFISENPLSFLRVTRAEAEFPENETPDRAKVFARARENLQKFIDDEVFSNDADSFVYIYRLSTDAYTQTGVVACCSLDEYELGKIKKHEKTRPDKVEDRTSHMVALSAQTGLIFLAFRSTETIKRLISETIQTQPLYDFHCVEGVRQTVWRAVRSEDFIRGFAEVPELYIADGHHRVESARLARNIMRDKNPHHTGAEDYNFVVAGMFPSEDLQILAYNRVVKDFNNLTEAEFFQKAGKNFSITETNEKVPANKNEFCVYTGAKWYKLKFAAERASRLNVIERLDVSILQNFLLAPVLGIEDPRTNQRIGFVGGARGTDELEKLVDEGSAKLALSMFPTTMDELFAVSDIGEIMPPKSTWFEPKLKDGLLVHLF